MATIYQAGSLNTTALTVPNLYVQIVQPQTLINGVSSGRIGMVGTASWGPVNTPVVVGGMGDYLSAFGAKQALATDMGTAVNAALLQGASDFRCVRVTDGTDTAATDTVQNQATVTALYTGSAGNEITISIPAFTPPATVPFTISHPTLGTEVWNVAIPSENTSFQPVADAINGNSKLIMVTVSGGGSSANGVETSGYVWTLSGGANGSAPPTSAFLGASGSASGAATGMYALASQSCAIGVLCGVTDPTSWSAQAAFGLSNGVYMITSGPSGDTIANASSTLSSSGATSYALKVMFGDWLWWDDDTNGLMLVPPSAFAAGILGALSPQNASLNKQLYGVVGSQKSGQVSSGGTLTYSDAELAALIGAGLDVICNPAPGGAYWACRSGHNSSLVADIQSDSYTRMTNYLAESFATNMGTYIGSVINATLFGDIRSTMLAFLSSCLSQGVLGSTTGALPYAVVCDSTNNPQARIALGYVQCDVQVQYQGINEKFIVNLQGGSSVTVTTSVAS